MKTSHFFIACLVVIVTVIAVYVWQNQGEAVDFDYLSLRHKESGLIVTLGSTVEAVKEQCDAANLPFELGEKDAKRENYWIHDGENNEYSTFLVYQDNILTKIISYSPNFETMDGASFTTWLSNEDWITPRDHKAKYRFFDKKGHLVDEGKSSRITHWMKYRFANGVNTAVSLSFYFSDI